MKKIVLFSLLLPGAVVSLNAQSQVIISPAVPPAVNQGSTFTFTANTGVTWSMAPGSKGTINASTGLYQAPTKVVAKQSHGACQVLPNNHIYNTKIDTLPVNASSTSWIAQNPTGQLQFIAGDGLLYNNTDASTPKEWMHFYTTPLSDDSFQMPPYPDVNIEGGWFIPPNAGVDRHLLSIDHSSSTFYETYNLYPVGTNTWIPCLPCNSAAGWKYSGSSYDLPANGSTDAAGMVFLPLSLHMQELLIAAATGGSVKHALRMTMTNAHLAAKHIWPATLEAFSESGLIPYGARFRLKSSFDTSGYSAIAKVILMQLKDYGAIVADGGNDYEIVTDGAFVPPAVKNAFLEIRKVTGGDLEAVDESGLMITANSGDTKIGAETVIATSTTNKTLSSQQRVVLTGVTVGLAEIQRNIQAGPATSPSQLIGWVNGASNKNINWTINPTSGLGTLTSTGMYTPPTAVSSVQTATVTATSVADPSVYAQMTLMILPSGTIRIAPGQTSDYTDTHGQVWSTASLADGGSPYFYQGPWPATPDIKLYNRGFYSTRDTRWDFTVPNGNYRITAKFADGGFGQGAQVMDVESQGKVIYTNLDIYTAAGGYVDTARPSIARKSCKRATVFRATASPF